MAADLLSVVIPVYRSERYLAATVEELVTALSAGGPFEILLVNDGSPDGVQEVIERLHRGDSRIRFICLGANVGQHRATLLGFAHARGGVVVTVDDDGQNPPSACLAVAQVLRADPGLDVVYGKFEVRRQGALRALASRANASMSRQALGNVNGVALSNVRAVRGGLARAIGQSSSSYPYLDALLFKATRRLTDTPVEHRPREDGGSTYSISKLVGLWISHLTTLTVWPLKLAAVGAFGASALGLALGAIKLAHVLQERKAPAGWLSLFVALTSLFSVLFVFMGIISAYLGRMYVSLNEQGLVWLRSTSEDAPSSKKPEE